MPREWLPTIATWLCISLVPACSPLLRQGQPSELSDLPITKRPEPPDRSGASVTANVPSHPDLIDPAVKPAAAKDTIIEPVRYPTTVARSPDLIPEPRSLTEPLGAVTVVTSPEQASQGGSRPEGKTEPVEEPPLLQAIRCYLDGRPTEAISCLGRYDKSSQDLLLCLLPLAVRATEGGLERCDSREASAIVKQMDRATDRVSALLRPRAKLGIKKMCFCSSVEGFGKYVPRPEGFSPGQRALIYVELENLRDQPAGNAYSIHLLSSLEIRGFREQEFGLLHRFDDVPNESRSERHDFYMWCYFEVPKDLAPGFYTLRLTIIDEPTRREATGTLDFRVTSAHGKGQW